MSNRPPLALALLLVVGVAVALRAQEPARDGPRAGEPRFHLEHLSSGQNREDVTIFDAETGRVYLIDDLESVRTIDPVAGTVTSRALRCAEREQAVRAIVAAVRGKDAAALRARMTRARLARYPDVAAWLLEAGAELAERGEEAWLRGLHLRFEDDAWRLDL